LEYALPKTLFPTGHLLPAAHGEVLETHQWKRSQPEGRKGWGGMKGLGIGYWLLAIRELVSEIHHDAGRHAEPESVVQVFTVAKSGCGFEPEDAKDAINGIAYLCIVL